MHVSSKYPTWEQSRFHVNCVINITSFIVKITIDGKDPWPKKLHNPLNLFFWCVIIRFFQLLKWGEVANPGCWTQQPLLTMWGSRCMNYHYNLKYAYCWKLNNCTRKWTNKRGYLKTIRQLINQNDGQQGLSNIAKKIGKDVTVPTIGNGQGKTSLITE